MVNPTHIVTTSFFYAIGNTPAVNITKDLPPDQDAAVLLLGCGDVRNILFSVYVGAGSNDQKIDLTCCDSETEILARNIILLTLILDDTENKDSEKIWNIYYHVLIDDDSLRLLRKQASRLQKVAVTAEEWNNGEYSGVLRFCDSYTFSQVSQLWAFYALQPSHGQAFKEQQEQLNHSTQRAREIQKEFVGDNTIVTGLRSAAPLSDCAFDNITDSYETFWKTGSPRLRQVSSPTNLNPMFGTVNSTSILHYGTDPIVGYHLATGYATLSDDSPLKTDPANTKDKDRCFNVALDQFHEFAKAFRKSASCLTLRFVVTDALALCHTLQHIQVHGSGSTAGWYRGFRAWKPLALDTADYSTENTGPIAPLSFDVIDTSNLADHFGCLNLLAAAGPILKPKSTSTLSTELLVQREADIDQYKKNLLFGDLSTVALVFSLVPIGVLTGTTTSSGFDERLTSGAARGAQADSIGTQSRFILHWKSSALPIEKSSRSNPESRISSLTFDAKELTRVLFQVYQGMFQGEDLENWLDGAQEGLRRKPFGHYTRASFAAILSLIRQSSMVDWESFISQLYELIDNNSRGSHAVYVAELSVHLDILGLRPMIGSELPSRPHIDQCPLHHWTKVPSTLCITMVVPGQKLEMFRKVSHVIESPIAQMVLRALDIQTQSVYMDIQAGFGHLKLLGNKYSETLALEIEDDPQKWDGTAPIIVSAMVPSSIALQKPDLSTEVLFALNQSPKTLATFSKDFGVDLAIGKSTLAGKDVYITKNRPNMSSPVSFSGITSPLIVDAKPALTPSQPDVGETKIRFHAQLAPNGSKLESMMVHIDILPGNLQDTLRSGAGVQVSQASSFAVSVSFDVGKLAKQIRFPTPVSMVGAKTRVARKSSYIEFIAKVASQKELSSRPDSLYIITLEKGSVELCNPHYVSLDRLPIFDRDNPSEFAWLSPRVSDMFSARERKMREAHMTSNSKCEDVRVKFKDSLMSLFSHVAGINGAQRHDVLALNNPENGGVHMLIFVSSLRLDMSCQHVVLDAAVLPLTVDIVPKISSLVHKIQQQGIISIIVDDEELLLWKHALPVFAERCRDWKHTPSCDYVTSGNVPVSVEFGQQPICSCGKGKFPMGYETELPGIWKQVAKYAVRVAIPPCFSLPFVERPFELKDFGNLDEGDDAGSIDNDVDEKLKALRLSKGSCFRCGKGKSDALLRCGGCKVAEYCSKDCQRTDWKEGRHKMLCSLLK